MSSDDGLGAYSVQRMSSDDGLGTYRLVTYSVCLVTMAWARTAYV